MRIELRNVKKKEDGVGVGFLIAFAVLCCGAYTLGHPDYAGVFPRQVERAFVNFRGETEFVADGVKRSFTGVYTMVAGR
jgi:hypothetical protein